MFIRVVHISMLRDEAEDPKEEKDKTDTGGMWVKG